MRNLLIASVIIALFFCTNCQKEVVDNFVFPRIRTLEVSDVTTEGATFYGEITLEGAIPVIEYGFLWDTLSTPSYSASERINVEQAMTTGTFECRISSSLIKDKKYYVKAFVHTSDYKVYGEVVEFVSNGSIPPKIHSIDPVSGHWNDTVTVKGERFNPRINKVLFGEINAKVVFNSDSLLRVIVPDQANSESVKIFIKTPDALSSSNDYFNYIQPQVNSFFPLVGTFNDTVSVLGTGFNTSKKYTSALLDGMPMRIVALSDTLIKFVVPCDLQTSTNTISVISESVQVDANIPFQLKPFTIDETVTDTISDLEGDILVSVYGDGFNPEIGYNKIKVDSDIAEIIEASPSKLVFKFPRHSWSFDTNYTFEKNYNVQLTIADQQKSSTEIFVLKNKGRWTWTKRADFPGKGRAYALSFVLDGKGYVGTGYDGSTYYSDFYEYNPETDSWREIASLPGGGRAKATEIVIDGVAYVGLGTEKIEGSTNELSPHLKKDWYKYDKGEDKWIRLNDFIGEPRFAAYSFVSGGLGYLGGGQIPSGLNDGNLKLATDFWQYQVSTETWIRKEDVVVPDGEGFTYNDDGYVAGRRNLYGLKDGYWNTSNLTYVGFDYSVSVLKDKVYKLLPNDHRGGTKYIYSFEMGNLNMEEIIFPGEMRTHVTSFSLGSSIFLTVGVESYLGSKKYNDMYQLEISE